MIFKPLASIAKIVAGQSPESSTYNSTGEGLPFFQGKADFQNMHPTVRMWCTSEKRKEAESGDILISVRAPVGAVNICNQKSIIGRGLAAIRPLFELDGKFLYYWLKANERKIDALGTGSTFKAITQDTLKKIEVPIPPLDDQIRIAHLLGKVEGLIAQRKQHLQQLDGLLKSVFLEMFGDPVRNEKGWPINPLSMYMSEQPNNGLYKPQSSYGSGTRIIRIDSFYDGVVQNIERLKRVEITDTELLKFEIRPFDVLVNRVNSIEYLGKIGVVPAISEPMVYESNMMRFRLNHKIMLPVFLMFFWRTPYLKSQINSKAKKAVNQASVNQQDVTGFLVTQPPIDLQNQFAAIVEKVEALKSRYQQSLTDLESLYGALSQQAFKGELDLLRLPMPKPPTQYVSAVSQGDQAAVPEPVVQTMPAIHLPDTANLLAALENAEARKALIAE